MDRGEPRVRRGAQHHLASPRMVMDHLPAPMGFVDRDLRVRCINQAGCRLYGYRSQRAVLGRTVPETIGPAPFARLRPALEAALSGETVVFEDVAPDRDGPGRDAISEDHYVPRFGPEQTVVGVDFLSIDVTARRRAEAAALNLCQQEALAHEGQRRNLALELHEGISQALTGLNLWLATGAGADPHVAGAQRLITGLTERTRRLAVELRPPELEDFNLLLVLRSAVRRFEQRTGIRIQFRADGGGYYLPDPVQTAVYRIVEAALSNIERHARVRKAAVTLTVKAAALTVTVSDDGPGFDPTRTRSGHGLGTMRVWANVAGGSVIVAAAPGTGVTVTAEVPVA
jgi:PAS domain S-box-containing protein